MKVFWEERQIEYWTNMSKSLLTSKSVVLKLKHASESLRGLVKAQIASLTQVFLMGWGYAENLHF